MNQRFQTTNKPTERKPTDLKGVSTTKKIGFDGSGDDPMLTDNCAKFYNSLCQNSKDNVAENAKLEWAFESEEEFNKRMDSLSQEESKTLEDALKEKLSRLNKDDEGLICCCGNPSCNYGYFIPASLVRRRFGL